jgi:hypothetical protein
MVVFDWGLASGAFNVEALLGSALNPSTHCELFKEQECRVLLGTLAVATLNKFPSKTIPSGQAT